ncbi:MAG TPA: hypothetical protein VMJ10_12615 [Kofleriaceae bacterium]|nr:hypothetical protein [Kofleriaceae bacterium]
MPVASLQSYTTVSLRVPSGAYAQQAAYLQGMVLARLQQQCAFQAVAAGSPADVMLDLNITAMGRGNGGLINNMNVATVDSLLVLSDGQSGELLGTARIHGKSSGIIVNGAPPEREAIDVVAKTVTDLLAHSGCAGPRVARVETPPQPQTIETPTTTTTVTPVSNPTTTTVTPVSNPVNPPPDDAARAKAEALNHDGTDKLRAADIAGAVAAFHQANQLVPDPKYAYNLCLALEAQEQWDSAVAACKQARGMNPDAKLAGKIDHRLDLLAHRQ